MKNKFPRFFFMKNKLFNDAAGVDTSDLIVSPSSDTLDLFSNPSPTLSADNTYSANSDTYIKVI